MNNEKIKMKVIVTHAKCLNCNTKRILYFTSNYTYGERIVSTQSGRYCAYADLLTEGIIDELEKFCKAIYAEKDITISHNKLARIITNIYGITCDKIDGEQIDTISNTRCPKCLGKKMIQDEKYGEQLKEISVSMVTHNAWEELEFVTKKVKVKEEMFRQGYLE